MQLSNKTYNRVKWLITIFLPAVGALYFALAQIWDFHRIAGVNGTINAIITFLGLLIGYSTKQYKKGEGAPPDSDIIVHQDPDDGTKYLRLAVTEETLRNLESRAQVTLNVVDRTKPDTEVIPPAPPVEQPKG